MGRTRWLILGLFILAFAAGLASAVAVERWHQPRARGGAESWLSRELNLRPEQVEKMRDIWGSLARDASQQQEEARKRDALKQWRDEAIRQLIPADRRSELDKIQDQYSVKLNELADQRRQSFELAEAKTKAILNDEQKVKYEAILSHRPEGRRGGGPGPATGPQF
jgi:hypothetical protein